MLSIIKDKPLVFFDLETTGTNMLTDRIVEISVVKLFPDGTREVKTRRINPEMHIPEEASAIHGIYDDDVRDAPTFRQIAQSLYIYLEDCDRLVDLIRWGDYGSFIMDKSKVGEHWGTHCPYFYGFKDETKVTDDPTDMGNYEIRYVEQSQRSSFSDKFLLLPFPYEEMNQNPSLVQNEGW